MNHGKAIAVKGIMTLVVLYLVLGLGFGISFWNVLLLTVILGVISYALGDLYILPKTSNMTATGADLGMAFLVLWLLGIPLTGLDAGTMAGAAIISALIMAIGEYFFHEYIRKKDYGTNRRYETSSDF
ncbi:DUF2512 family protein [Oceanobacillus damuensis]|uniref:DUF2512 family protein n=1 Tax=Oceanobacillus damuensis TaxID=937928 RepID=UPI000830E359|nr:DUF2512 family protein [Oceanobacillus damuensis]